MINSLMLTFNDNSYAQDLPYYFIDAVNYSIKYEFSGNNYIINQHDYYDYNNGAVPYLQSRYDSGFNLIQNEIFKLKGLILINKNNREYLSKFFIELELDYKKNYMNINFGNEYNLNIVLKRITHYINGKWKIDGKETTNPIADEIKLLKKIFFEYYKLKENLDFYNSKRWFELKNLINELKDCPISEIPFLGPKYNLY